MPLARAISRGAFLKARLGVKGIQNDSRSLGTAVATASLLACGMSASRMDFWARRAPGIWPRYSSRRAGTKSPQNLPHAPDCRSLFRGDHIASERAANDSLSPLAGRGLGWGAPSPAPP